MKTYRLILQEQLGDSIPGPIMGIVEFRAVEEVASKAFNTAIEVIDEGAESGRNVPPPEQVKL